MSFELPAYDWQPRASQMKGWEAMEMNQRLIVLAWHRRNGKDELALQNAAIKAMQRVGNYWHMLPKQEQARKAIWEAINPKTGRKRWEDAFPNEIIKHVDNQAMQLTLVNDSTWQLLGSDNYNSVVGSSPVGITFSEAALADPNAYGFFKPILTENNGWSVHISSTRGKNHFYRLYKLAEEDPNAFAEHLSAEDTDVFTEQQLADELREYCALYGEAFGRALFEQEYLSKWEASNPGAVFGPELDSLEREGRAAPFVYDPRYPVDTSWDIGVRDDTVILFWQLIGNVDRLIDVYSSNDAGIDHYAEVLADKPYFYQHHIGPHDVEDREWGNKGLSRTDQAAQYGIHFHRNPKTGKSVRISAGCSLARNMEINISDRPTEERFDDCSLVLEALRHYHYKFDKDRMILSKDPFHDWSSHYADAFMERAIWRQAHELPHRKQVLQGRHVQAEYDQLRMRDIFRQKQQEKDSSTGAWG